MPMEFGKERKAKFGLLLEFDPRTRDGVILLPNNARRRFYLAPSDIPMQEFRPARPVQFLERWITPNHCEIESVKPADLSSIPFHPGRVKFVRSFGDYAFVTLDDGRDAFVRGELIRDDALQPGQRVRCHVIAGVEGRWFTLAIENAERLRSQPTPPQIGVSTRKGRAPAKHVNEDAFLVQPLADGRMWLLAIADGVSEPRNGWWASDKCLELLWRSRDAFEQAYPNQLNKTFMHERIDEIHQEFLRWRRGAPAEFQQATSTLTFAAVLPEERKVFYAHCGDSRLYILDTADPRSHHARNTGAHLRGLISEQLESQRGRGRGGRLGLSNHIAAGAQNWNPVVGVDEIGHKGLVLLCTDGVVSRDRSEYRNRKQEFLKTLIERRDGFQALVDDIIANIASLGEPDDLTLVALRPAD